MIAVLYRPTPPESATGPIVQQMSGTESVIAYTAIQADLEYVVVAEERDDWDRAFTVVDGEVVAL